MKLLGKIKIDLISDDSPQLELENIKFNSEYFGENGLTKDIPKGKTVLSLEYRVLNESSAEQARSINGKDGYMVIDYVSDSDVKEQNQLLIFISAIPSFFTEIFKGIL